MSKLGTGLVKTLTLAAPILTLRCAKNGSLLLALALFLGSCDLNKEAVPPPEMIGTYRTNDPRYEGLYFRIEKGMFDFSTVEGTVETYPIVAYEKLDRTNGRRKTIYHLLHGKRDGQELKVSFNFEPDGGGTISFLNRPGTIWLRESDAVK